MGSSSELSKLKVHSGEKYHHSWMHHCNLPGQFEYIKSRGPLCWRRCLARFLRAICTAAPCTERKRVRTDRYIRLTGMKNAQLSEALHSPGQFEYIKSRGPLCWRRCLARFLRAICTAAPCTERKRVRADWYIRLTGSYVWFYLTSRYIGLIIFKVRKFILARGALYRWELLYLCRTLITWTG